MIGKIEKTDDKHPTGAGRKRYTVIEWDMATTDLGARRSTLLGSVGLMINRIQKPRRSKLPGILGTVGDTVEVTVRVIPKEGSEASDED